MNEMIRATLGDGLLSNRHFSSMRPLKKGVVFTFESKAKMSQGVGKIVRSETQIDSTNLSHWTPNIYSWGGYANEFTKTIRGNDERNLNQINCFVIDIDFGYDKKIDQANLIGKTIDSGFLPTYVIDTPKGYQIYYLLKNPSYISSANNYKSIEVAKKISINLRNNLKELLPEVDAGCNHFGIFRIPTEKNTIFYEPQVTYSFEQLMHWSIQYSQNNQPKLKVLASKGSYQKQVKTNWFREIIQLKNVNCGQGIGRNNTIMTLALACYSSGVTKDQCFDTLDEFNTNLVYPLSNREVNKIIESAYSGKYRGANKRYVKEIIENWGNGIAVSQTHYWYKFKKDRASRVNSHLFEWENDLFSLIDSYNKSSNTLSDFMIKTTSEKLMSELNIPKTSFYRLLKSLKQNTNILFDSKTGRNGYIKLAKKSNICAFLLMKKNEMTVNKIKYLEQIAKYFGVKSPLSILDILQMNRYLSHEIQAEMQLDTG